MVELCGETFFLWACISNSTMSYMNEQNPRIVFTILIVYADNTTSSVVSMRPTLCRPIEVLLHHYISILAHINETRQHNCCHFSMVFCERIVQL